MTQLTQWNYWMRLLPKDRDEWLVVALVIFLVVCLILGLEQQDKERKRRQQEQNDWEEANHD